MNLNCITMMSPDEQDWAVDNLPKDWITTENDYYEDCELDWWNSLTTHYNSLYFPS